MNKLVTLLNEYRTEKGERNLNEFEVSQTLDSLKFLRPFIKWLVDNDKIDFSRDGKYCEKSIEEFDGLLRADEDSLIMILAIQEKPIEFLISILK